MTGKEAYGLPRPFRDSGPRAIAAPLSDAPTQGRVAAEVGGDDDSYFTP